MEYAVPAKTEFCTSDPNGNTASYLRLVVSRANGRLLPGLLKNLAKSSRICQEFATRVEPFRAFLVGSELWLPNDNHDDKRPYVD